MQPARILMIEDNEADIHRGVFFSIRQRHRRQLIFVRIGRRIRVREREVRAVAGLRVESGGKAKGE